jgi:hypothetical protein
VIGEREVLDRGATLDIEKNNSTIQTIHSLSLQFLKLVDPSLMQVWLLDMGRRWCCRRAAHYIQQSTLHSLLILQRHRHYHVSFFLSCSIALHDLLLAHTIAIVVVVARLMPPPFFCRHDCSLLNGTSRVLTGTTTSFMPLSLCKCHVLCVLLHDR